MKWLVDGLGGAEEERGPLLNPTWIQQNCPINFAQGFVNNALAYLRLPHQSQEQIPHPLNTTLDYPVAQHKFFPLMNEHSGAPGVE